MVPAVSYKEVCSFVAAKYGDYGWNDPPGPNHKVRMVGLLFAPPHELLAKSEIVPRLDDFHHRSGSNFDWFCAGYARGGQKPPLGYSPVGVGGWLYSPARFDQFRREIESMSRWRYSGESDLLLANARYDEKARSGCIDFGAVIVCKLNALKKDEAIRSVGSFFEAVIRYAEKSDAKDPTWGFSDAQGRAIGGTALKRVVLSLLPKELGKDAVRAAHFAVQDVTVVRETKPWWRFW